MNISSTSCDNTQRPDFAQMRAERFKKADTDGNGTISKDELTTMIENAPQRPEGAQAPNVDELFAKIDTDGDGQISEVEDTAFAESMHAKHGHHGRGAQGTGDFANSGDTIKKLLDALSGNTDGSSGSTDSTDGSTSIEQQLAQLLTKLQQQQQDATYTSDGTRQPQDTTTLFTENV